MMEKGKEKETLNIRLSGGAEIVAARGAWAQRKEMEQERKVKLAISAPSPELTATRKGQRMRMGRRSVNSWILGDFATQEMSSFGDSNGFLLQI